MLAPWRTCHPSKLLLAVMSPGEEDTGIQGSNSHPSHTVPELSLYFTSLIQSNWYRLGKGKKQKSNVIHR